MLLLSLAASAVLAAPAPTKAVPATYGFGSGTEIVYYVEHPMHHVKGVTHALDGQVAFADGKPVAPFTLSLPLISFNSGNANRDENAAHVLDVPHYPLATLEVKQFTEKSRAKNGQATHLTGLAVGTLRFKGVAHETSVPVTIDVAPGQLVVDGTLTLKLTDYQVDRPALLFTPISDDVKVTIHAVGAPTR